MRQTAPTAPPLARSHAAGAFTLVELLVVISVIALLIGILVPGLQIARRKAQDVVCVANMNAILPAWHMYVADHGRFPTRGSGPRDQPPISDGWAGTSVFVGNTPQGNLRGMRSRVLNEYLSMDEQTRARVNALRCPRDNGAIYSQSGLTLREGDGAAFQYLEDNGDDSHFFLRGNSYYANDWMWCNIGSPDGAGPAQARRWNHWLKPDTAIDNPAMTITIGDAGALDAGALTDEALTQVEARLGWWHGERECTVGMWDGSGKSITMTPGGYGQGYRMWLQPDRHPDDGTPVGKFWTTRFSTSDYANAR